MRILFLTPSVRLLGARQSLLALAAGLPRGAEALVVCPGEGGLAEELRRAGVAVEVVPHGAWRKLGGRARASLVQIPAIRRIVRRFEPDVIHCNEFHSTPQGVKSSGGRVAATSHVRLSITPRQIGNYLLPACDRIAAVSRACRELFASTELIDRVEVIYNGVDVSRFQRRGSDEAGLRDKCGWKNGTLVCGLFGLVSPRKNQLVAVEAIAQANRRGVPARLLIAGDSFNSTEDYGRSLRERIEAEELRDKIKWLPFQKEVPSLYEACDINLLISNEEGFGRTIIEAGAMGIPSIGARTGGIPELILENATGWLVNEGSPGELADVLVRLHHEREQIHHAGEAARKRVESHFTIEAHVQAMMRFWEKAIERRGKNQNDREG